MTKKEHVHLVTNTKHKEILEQLGKQFGSMTKAFEIAIETLNKSETVGSCDNCKVKFDYDQITTFQELLNTVTFTHDNIQELVRYLQGDCTIQELLFRARERARQFVKQYLKGFLQISFENTYDALINAVEEWKQKTRLFKSLQIDKHGKLILARVNILEKLPIFVAMGLFGYLEAFEFTFDVDIIDETIILKWLDPEMYLLEKNKIESKISGYVGDSDQYVKPYFIKQGFLPISPEFLDWVSEVLLSHEIYPIDISYRFINQFFGDDFIPPKSAKEWAQVLSNILKSVNYVEQIRMNVIEKENTFKLSMICKTPHLTTLLLQNAIIIMAKYGWKLKNHRISFKELDLSMHYVGEDAPDILQPLYLINFAGYLNQRFQKLRLIPVDQFDDLNRALYAADPIAFREVYHKQGLKFANALRILAKNNLRKMREIGLQVIPQLIKGSQRNPKDINIISEPNKFTLIFKTTDTVEMEILGSIFIAVMEGFEYKDIKSKILENILAIEFKRPQDIEVSSLKIGY